MNAKNHSMTLQEWMLLLCISVIWGSSFFVIEIALRELQPFTLVLYRIGLAAIIITMLTYINGQRLPFDLLSWKRFFILGAVNNFIPFAFISWGQTHIDSGLASVLNATTPLFVVVMAHYLTHDEHLTWNRLAGVFLGIVGVGVLVGPDALSGLSSHILGQFAILAAAFSYACGGIYIRQLKDMPVLTAISGTLIAATIYTLPCAIFFESPLILQPQWSTIGAILGMSVLGTAFAYLLYFKLIRTAGATNTLLVTFLVPVTALAMGVMFLNEKLSVTDISGMLIIFSGLILVDGRIMKRSKDRSEI